MKKFLVSLAAAFVLCVPAFADNEVYFAPSPFTFSNPSGYLNITASSADPSVPCYCFLRYSNSGNTQLRVFAISATQGATVNYSGVISDGTSNTTSTSCNLAAGDYFVGALDFVGGTDLPNLVTTDNLSIFPYNTDMSVIGSAFTDYLSNPPAPTPSIHSSFTLPRGNVLYFKVASEQNVYFTSYMDTLSNIINFNTATYGAWGDTGQRYGEAAALPTAGTVFPLLSQSPIAWQKDSSTNILGQTKVGLATKHCIVGQWYCFYNPNANHVEGADPYNASPGASVVIQGSFSQIKVYPVNQKLSVVDGDLYSGSNDDFDSFYDGSVDQDGTVTWTNQDGNIEAPAAGGQNFEDGPKSATSLLEGIRVTLETVVHELQTLFTFGYSAIQSLVGIMSDFVSVFSGLYTWLPAEVYSALMSAVVVAIVIGVFKVFL